MKPSLFLVVACLCASLARAAAGSLEPILSRGFGTTLYRLEIPFPISGDSIPESARGIGQSELEYPLDAFHAGLRYRHASGGGANRNLGITLAAWANVSQPSGPMEDSDWLGARASEGITTSTVLFKFSYTRSVADLTGFGGEAGLDFGDYRLFDKPVRYGINLRAEHFDYRLTGVDGWQRMPDRPASTPVAGYRDTLVLTYRLTRIMPRLFADFRLAQGGPVTWSLLLSGAPALAFDHDDHVLRRKESETLAFGVEIGGRTELGLRLSARTALIAAAELAYLRSKGEMDQRFYGDDPFTSDDETGREFKGVETRIISLSGALSLGVRYLF